MLLKKRRYNLILIVLFLVFLIPSSQVFATGEGAGYTVQAILPDSQLDNGNTYFDLNLQPGEKETLGIEVVNQTNLEKILQISTHSAFTNSAGLVVYSATPESYHSSLKYLMDDLIETPETITLAPNETKVVNLALQMPKEAFEGVLAGGIRVQEVKEEKKKAESDTGLSVENTFSYVIAVVLSNEREPVTAELELVDVYPDPSTYRNTVTAVLQNTYPTFVNQVEIDATITKEGEEEFFAVSNKKGMQMAPNSDFAFPIELPEGKAFEAGTYTLEMTARSKEQEWHWTKTFEVSASVAKKLNANDLYVEDPTNWQIIVIMLLVLIIVYLIYRNYQQRKAGEKEEESSL